MSEETELELRQQIAELRMLVESLMLGGEMLHEPSAGGYAMPESGGADPHPFEVRWSESENSGNGAWIIYIKEGFVQLGESDVVITSVITATSEANWYTIDELTASGGTVWLAIRPSTESGEDALAVIRSSKNENAGWFNIKVATVSRTGDPAVVTKNQFLTTAYVHSPIVLKGSADDADAEIVSGIVIKPADDTALEANVTKKDDGTGFGEVKIGVYYK